MGGFAHGEPALHPSPHDGPAAAPDRDRRVKPPRRCFRDPIDAFWFRTRKTDSCWFWTGSLDRYGYGRMTIARRTIKAYQFAFRAFKRRIPKGREIDHACHVRACVNPDHLEAVTHAENMARSITGRCRRGHLFIDANSARNGPDGKRTCRICRAARDRIRSRRRYAMKRGPDLRPRPHVRIPDDGLIRAIQLKQQQRRKEAM